MNAFNLLFGFLSLPRLIGVDLVADFNLVDLVSDILWGGVWGLLFLLPFLENMLTLKGVLIGFFSFCVQLLVTVSYIHHHPITINDPLLLIGYLLGLNVFWGVVASICWGSWRDLATQAK